MSSKYELPRGYLSASSIGMLLNCPKQFEFRYVKGLVIPPGAALVTGSAMHRTLETYYKDAMTSSQRLTGKQAAELAVTSLDEVLEEGENTVSTDETYTFPMGTADKNLTAVFDAGTSVTPETSHTLTVTAREGGTASGGGTYAKELPGIIAFGCEWPDEDNRIHNADEFLKIDQFKMQVEIYVKAIENLLAL